MAVHLLSLVGGTWLLGTRDPAVDDIDIELAPTAPPVEALPAEVLRQQLEAAKAAASTEPAPPPDEDSAQPHDPSEGASIDAGVDARADATIDAPADAAIDARVDAPIDAAIDAPIDAAIDAAIDAPIDGGDPDAMTVATITDGGAIAIKDDLLGSGSGSGEQRAGSGEPTAGSGTGPGSGSGSGSGSGTAAGSGSGSSSLSTTTDAAILGAQTSPGTAANLLAYFPPGHVVTALIRFDRLRNTEWAALTERILKPLPDYHALFANRDAKLADACDTLVMSSPTPRDATATTLVAHTSLTRPALRTYLTTPTTPVAWSASAGGLLGHRSGPGVLPNDKRVFLSPFRGWFLLAQPADLPALLAPARGSLDTVEASAKLPPWLAQIRAIETETGKPSGPALVVTYAPTWPRLKLPNIGLGIRSLPMPERLSLALELVPQGWLLRGNIRFPSTKDALEFVTSIRSAQSQITSGYLIGPALRQAHLYNAIAGLTLALTDQRVSYATSISVADARALLTAAAQMTDETFGQAAPSPSPSPSPP